MGNAAGVVDYTAAGEDGSHRLRRLSRNITAVTCARIAGSAANPSTPTHLHPEAKASRHAPSSFVRDAAVGGEISCGGGDDDDGGDSGRRAAHPRSDSSFLAPPRLLLLGSATKSAEVESNDITPPLQVSRIINEAEATKSTDPITPGKCGAYAPPVSPTIFTRMLRAEPVNADDYAEAKNGGEEGGDSMGGDGSGRECMGEQASLGLQVAAAELGSDKAAGAGSCAVSGVAGFAGAFEQPTSVAFLSPDVDQLLGGVVERLATQAVRRRSPTSSPSKRPALPSPLSPVIKQ